MKKFLSLFVMMFTMFVGSFANAADVSGYLRSIQEISSRPASRHLNVDGLLKPFPIANAAVETTKDGKTYIFLWSHYTGWELWQYLADSGIMEKWCKKYGVKIKIVMVNDYVTSINQYTAGEAIGCAMTNMDLLNMPAVGGVKSLVPVVGDFSNGNDGICLMNGKTMKDIKGRKVLIVQGSVSSYLLSRALATADLKDSDVVEVNTSDANIAATFANSGSKGACVTWNPPLMTVRNQPKSQMVFDSSMIPGEIQDLPVVREDAPENVIRALVGAWFEGTAIMNGQGKKTDECIESMAKFAGGTVPEFKAQLKTTRMFWTPAESVAFAEGKEVKATAKLVSAFCFDHGLLGGTAKNAEFIGVKFPDGTVYGDPKNVKVTYTTKYMQELMAEGK